MDNEFYAGTIILLSLVCLTPLAVFFLGPPGLLPCGLLLFFGVRHLRKSRS